MMIRIVEIGGKKSENSRIVIVVQTNHEGSFRFVLTVYQITFAITIFFGCGPLIR
jgi:hypothetical protein